MTTFLVVLSIHGMELTLSLNALRTSIIMSSAWKMETKEIRRYFNENQGRAPREWSSIDFP